EVGDWDLALFFTLAGFSAVSDLRAVETGTRVKIPGSFLALVLAMVFLGPTQAALIGFSTIVLGWFRWRDKPHDLLNNLLAYTWFPLLGGLVFHAAQDEANVGQSDGFFYLLV